MRLDQLRLLFEAGTLMAAEIVAAPLEPEPAPRWRCCMEHADVGTRPTRDGFQAVRWKLGRPSSVIRLRIRTPILASVF